MGCVSHKQDHPKNIQLRFILAEATKPIITCNVDQKGWVLVYVRGHLAICEHHVNTGRTAFSMTICCHYRSHTSSFFKILFDFFRLETNSCCSWLHFQYPSFRHSTFDNANPVDDCSYHGFVLCGHLPSCCSSILVPRRLGQCPYYGCC
jgi:hypothetical protein